MEALLIRFAMTPEPSVFEDTQGSVDRLDKLKSFYADIKQQVRSRLADLPVEIVDLEAMGALLVHGELAALNELRRPGGPLDLEGVVIEDDMTFETSS